MYGFHKFDSSLHTLIKSRQTWVGRSPGGGKPTPAFLPGESHGQWRLTGYSPQGHKESDTTEVT